MAELVDAVDSKSTECEFMPVRFRLRPPLELSIVDTKISAIFSFNTTNINDFMAFLQQL